MLHHSVLDAFSAYAQLPGTFPNLQAISYQGRSTSPQSGLSQMLRYVMRPSVISVEIRCRRIVKQKHVEWINQVLSAVAPFGKTIRELKMGTGWIEKNLRVSPSLGFALEKGLSSMNDLTYLELIAPPSSTSWAIIASYPHLRCLVATMDTISLDDCFTSLRMPLFASLECLHLHDTAISAAFTLLKNINSDALNSVRLHLKDVNHPHQIEEICILLSSRPVG
jgi:hypothetical protein